MSLFMNVPLAAGRRVPSTAAAIGEGRLMKVLSALRRDAFDYTRRNALQLPNPWLHCVDIPLHGDGLSHGLGIGVACTILLHLVMYMSMVSRLIVFHVIIMNRLSVMLVFS